MTTVWTHRDVLRLAHPKTTNIEKNALYNYITKGIPSYNSMSEEVGAYISAVEQIKRTDSVSVASDLIKHYNLPREVVPTEFLKTPEVWDALLQPGENRFMPMTAMIRNLGVMTANGFLKPMSSQTRVVVDRLLDEEALRRARVHPIQILAALITYKRGAGARGNLSWSPVSEVVDALDEAFYISFGNVEPTNKRRLMGIDVSGSMTYQDVSGIPGLTPNVAAAALAMVSAKVEKQYHIMGFAHNFRDLGVTSRDSLTDAIRKTQDMSFGGTDCSLPMKYALQNGLEVDSFEVYTDNETYYGGIHPSQALQQYRRETGIPATLSVVSMVSTYHTIADPQDSGMIDLVGFDTSTPNILSDFISGKL
jgi:60 kDa SS-A/Ro ribonucleoprotein